MKKLFLIIPVLAGGFYFAATAQAWDDQDCLDWWNLHGVKHADCIDWTPPSPSPSVTPTPDTVVPKLPETHHHNGPELFPQLG